MKKLTFEQKARMTREIFEAFSWLGIRHSSFLFLKNQHGGLVGLYKEMERRISGK